MYFYVHKLKKIYVVLLAYFLLSLNSNKVFCLIFETPGPFSFSDVDECATRQNNCTNDQMCVNTYGGFQCVRVDCPKIPHATYVKTSPM